MGAAADWRRAEPYAHLMRCDRALFAWEWLRRGPDYRRAAIAPDGSTADRFGLVRFEPPDCATPRARPIWRADMDPAVLTAAAIPAPNARAFALDRLRRLAILHREGPREHLLLSDGNQALRLDIVAGTLGEGPVRLHWHLAGLEGVLPPLDALRRLDLLYRQGSFGVATQPTRPRARRWVTLLRVRDALLDGASTRDIAEAFFGDDIAGPRWRIRSSPWRARVQRLVAAVRCAEARGPRAFLR